MNDNYTYVKGWIYEEHPKHLPNRQFYCPKCLVAVSCWNPPKNKCWRCGYSPEVKLKNAFKVKDNDSK